MGWLRHRLPFVLAVLMLLGATLGTGDAAAATAGGLTPLRAIPAPRAVRSVHALSVVPVVVIPATFTTAGPHPRPVSVPAVEWMPVSSRIARHLAAYLVPLGFGEWVTLLGPRGLTGQMFLATDGGKDLTLRGAHARLSLGLAGGSPPLAAQSVSDLFTSAGQWLDREFDPAMWAPRDILHPATLSYSDHRRVVRYAYRARNGWTVAGVAAYRPGVSGGAAELEYAASGPAAAVAPWVLHQGLAVVRVYALRGGGIAPGAIPVVPPGVPRVSHRGAIPLVPWRVVGLPPRSPGPPQGTRARVRGGTDRHRP